MGVKPIYDSYTHLLEDTAREKEVLDNWPEPLKFKELMYLDQSMKMMVPDEHGVLHEYTTTFESIMMSVKITIVRIIMAGTNVEYSGTGLFGWDWKQYFTPFYFTPYPEEEAPEKRRILMELVYFMALA